MTGSTTPERVPLDDLLAYLKQARGFDFAGYKRSSLERRIQRRMQEVDVTGYDDYLDYLEVHQDEFARLFDTVLINVTGFFRDAPAWDYLASDVVPRLLESLNDADPIRVWCAGCASGEETYTMAMVLADALGLDDYFRRVKIYATEIDEDALNEARHGVYGARQVEPVPQALLERYFERSDGRYAFRRDMRRTVIFGRNDLTQDAPISRIDLLTCRNTLMYFNAEMQARILGRLHFALNPWGYLFLGKSEMLITHSDLFRPVNLRRRVFTKVVRASRRDRGTGRLNAAAEIPEPFVGLREAAHDAAPAAMVVVDVDGTVVDINGRARSMFNLSVADVGRPLRDLELSYRPVDLRSNLETAYGERRAVAIDNVTHAASGADARVLQVEITPLHSAERVLGAAITYHDVSQERRTQEELEASKRELSNAYEELQATVEELETTNEELLSTNEELETTNEELQSANEELETMNEELQSTNEELETINDELRERSIELNGVNQFLERILGSMSLAVIVVDRDETVQVWSRQAADLWGVRTDEAQGRPLSQLDIGLPLDGIRPLVHPVLSGDEERAESYVDAVNRRGRRVRLRVRCLALGPPAGAVTGAVVLMEQANTPGDGAGGDIADVRADLRDVDASA